jgi:hypothetical protein
VPPGLLSKESHQELGEATKYVTDPFWSPLDDLTGLKAAIISDRIGSYLTVDRVKQNATIVIYLVHGTHSLFTRQEAIYSHTVTLHSDERLSYFHHSSVLISAIPDAQWC